MPRARQFVFDGWRRRRFPCRSHATDFAWSAILRTAAAGGVGASNARPGPSAAPDRGWHWLQSQRGPLRTSANYTESADGGCAGLLPILRSPGPPVFLAVEEESLLTTSIKKARSASVIFLASALSLSKSRASAPGCPASSANSSRVRRGVCREAGSPSPLQNSL